MPIIRKYKVECGLVPLNNSDNRQPRPQLCPQVQSPTTMYSSPPTDEVLLTCSSSRSDESSCPGTISVNISDMTFVFPRTTSSSLRSLAIFGSQGGKQEGDVSQLCLGDQNEPHYRKGQICPLGHLVIFCMDSAGAAFPSPSGLPVRDFSLERT